MTCTHNAMVPNNDERLAWRCADCGYVYGSDDEPFTLANDPPRHKPATFANDECRQLKLLDGLDCLPGQMDLFDNATGQA